MTTYQGVLLFHSETGTEGGAWAFQDAEFMHLPGPNQFHCTTCYRVWDRDANAEPPKPTFLYWRTGDGGEGKSSLGGYHATDTYDPEGSLGPGDFDQEFTRKGNDAAKLCADNGHSEWVPMYPDGITSYEGLHILNDGDHLTVYDEHDQVLFKGVIDLPPRQDPYAEGAYAAGGYYAAHRMPPKNSQEQWWFEELKATLVTP